jgi:hypothetical protein
VDGEGKARLTCDISNFGCSAGLEAFGDFVVIWCACGSGSGAKSWEI